MSGYLKVAQYGKTRHAIITLDEFGMPIETTAIWMPSSKAYRTQSGEVISPIRNAGRLAQQIAALAGITTTIIEGA